MNDELTLECLEGAAGIFKALADPARLFTLTCLAKQDLNVSELAQLEGVQIGTISARLKVLLQANLVSKHRNGRNIIYSLADHHVLSLVENAIEHANEDH